jgi:hypothetical protein
MNPLILNRSTGKLPDDGWYQIEVPGEHINHEARVVEVIDDKALASILNRFSRTAAQPNFGGLLVDKDHFSLDSKQTTEAMGWAMELRNRAGIPEARIDWTKLGLPLIEAKPGQPPAYKYFSTVYDPEKGVEKLGTRVVAGQRYTVVRPLELDRLALTNDPNNKGGKPISNRSGTSAGAAENQTIDTTMKSLLKELGLADDASEQSALAALQVIKNRAAQGDAIKAERDTLLAAQVESDLEKYKGVIKNRDVVKKQLLANRASAIEFLEALQEQAAAPADKPAPITNRAGAKPPPTSPTGDAAAAEAAEQRATKISNRARQIRTGNPAVSLADAYTTAAAEIDAEAKK